MHDGLLGRIFQADVDEARSRQLDGVDPTLKSGGGQQSSTQGFAQLAGVLFEGFGQLHGGCARQVAMGRHFGGFEGRTAACTGVQFFEFSRQGGQQMLFGRKHGGILRGAAVSHLRGALVCVYLQLITRV
jgi:hypothetical protein